MHTDDVFMGITVSKVPIFKTGIIEENHMSAFTPEGYKKEKKLTNEWKKGNIVFFHVPSSQLYKEWTTER